MTPDLFFGRIVEPTLQWMAASPTIAIPVTASARVLMMAIAGQESRWAARRQVGGPARSYWQGEKTGGMVLAAHHPVTAPLAAVVFRAFDIGEPNLYRWVAPSASTIYEALAWHDPLACAMARLLLWSDPAPLPQYWDKAAGWQYYLRTWRPGAPHPETWSAIHDQAMAACGLPPT